MTIEQYNRATEILEEKKLLEKKIYQLRTSVDFLNSDEYVEISNKLFKLGQEFASL